MSLKENGCTTFSVSSNKKNTRNGLKHYLRKKPYILHLIPLNPIECTLRDVRESNP